MDAGHLRHGSRNATTTVVMTIFVMAVSVRVLVVGTAAVAATTGRTSVAVIEVDSRVSLTVGNGHEAANHEKLEHDVAGRQLLCEAIDITESN